MLAPRMGEFDPCELARVEQNKILHEQTSCGSKWHNDFSWKSWICIDTNNAKVNLLLKTSYREDHNTVISYISVWWEVALEIDFFQQTVFIKFTKMQNHEFGHEWSRNSILWGLGKGNRHRITRSSDLDYSQHSKQKENELCYWMLLISPGLGTGNTVFPAIIGRPQPCPIKGPWILRAYW